MECIKIIGIDPGSHKLGVAIIKKFSQKLELIHHETLVAPAKETFHERLKFLNEKILSILDQHSPDELAVETAFFGVNAKSAFQLGVTRGVILSSFLERNISIHEYSPTQIKAAVTGHGRSDKEQVKKMVEIIFSQKLNAKHYDATDAIAIAVCHAHSTRLKQQYDRLPRRLHTLEK